MISQSKSARCCAGHNEAAIEQDAAIKRYADTMEDRGAATQTESSMQANGEQRQDCANGLQRNDSSLCATDYQQEYYQIIEELGGDEQGRRAAWAKAKSGHSFFQGKPAPFSFTPFVYNSEERRILKNAAETTYGILRKVARQYRDDASFRKLFRFDSRVEELVLLPNASDEPLPIARVDLFFNRSTGDFRFCEFNTDSSSGMNENAQALECIRASESYRRFAEQHHVQDDVELHFDGWVRHFKQLYESWAERNAAQQDPARPNKPRVAIVVCFDSPNPHLDEQKLYLQAFKRAGMECSVFDVRQLEFDGDQLMGHKALAGESEVPIDCIWRFCLIVDLLEYWDKVQPFICAVRSGKVPMFGGFSTQVLHDKQLFAVLHHPQTQAFLSPDEQRFVQEHIPQTMFLDDPQLDLDEVKAHPKRWVIKPCDWYASINVVVGAECEPETWAQLVDEHSRHAGGSFFLLQECCEQTPSPTIALYGNETDFTASWTNFGAITGLYLFAGSFAGIYVRQGPHRVIGSAREGLVTPVLWLD